MIPVDIKVKNNSIPDEPGVYFYYDKNDTLLYIGKATSLKRRGSSYFNGAHDRKTEELVGKIARISYIETPTVIEALVLEANKIREHQPPYNIRQKDDKSFAYLVITNEAYPKPIIMRGLELSRMGINPLLPPPGGGKCRRKADNRHRVAEHEKFLHLFGPYTNAKSLRTALDLLRKIIPWSTCHPGQKRPCFSAQIGACPGVCIEAVTPREYKRVIRSLVLFFSGKKTQLIGQMKREMTRAAKNQDYERAAAFRNRLFALEHIRDVSLITREETAEYLSTENDYIDLNGRIEAYDISNISGTSATGSMVVFESGKPVKDAYRKFKIKSIDGPNDVGMMEEMMRRRLARVSRGWELPEVMVIDGGVGQVRRVKDVMRELGVSVPVLGIAKGFDRKQDRLVFDKKDAELARVATRGKELFQKARDEAHRFAVTYHRVLRAKKFVKKV